MKNKNIILTRGIQGSGKSTWAKAWVEEDPTNRIRFNNDDMRYMGGVYWPSSNKALTKREDALKKIRQFAIKTYMDAGYDIVVDNMNLNPKEYDTWNNICKNFNETCKEYNYSIEYKDFFIPVDECIRRDAARPNPIGAKVIKETFRRYRNVIANALNTGYIESRKVQDPNKKNCILVDMDATLCFNTTGRPFFGAGAAEGMYNDIPCKEMVHLVNTYLKDDSVDVIILTGREDTPEIRKATEEWCKQNLIKMPYKVLMRPYKDFSHGEDCKLNLYKNYVESKYNVLFILEDSSKVVKKWRDNGLICLQVNEGVL